MRGVATISKSSSVMYQLCSSSWYKRGLLQASFFSSQVCLAYLLQRGIVAIPKSVKAARITENMDSTRISLDDKDVKDLSELNQNFRVCKVSLHSKLAIMNHLEFMLLILCCREISS